MKTIRIHNDISFAWHFFVAGEETPVPYILDGKDIKITITNQFGVSITPRVSINENTALFTFFGKEQDTTGEYTLTMYENAGQTGEKTIDKITPFCLVGEQDTVIKDSPCGCEFPTLDIVTLDLSSDVTIGGTNNYNDLENKPSINGQELVGNKSLEDLGIEEYVDAQVTQEQERAEGVETALAQSIGAEVERATQKEQELDESKQGKIADLATIREGAQLGSTALQTVPDTYRPSPEQDAIDDAIKGRIAAIENKAAGWDSKYQKPASGIPASDLAEGVIPDVSQFVTKSVNDLLNYYLKSETYTKSEVQALIAAVKQFTYEVVDTLPTASADTMHKIYLVPSSEPETQNVKDEYITIDNGEQAETRYTWEQIGSTAIDLSGYSTTEQMNAAIATAVAPFKTEEQIRAIITAYGYETVEGAEGKYVAKVTGKGLSTNDYSNEDKQKVGTALQPSEQTLTEEQQAQARSNINAPSKDGYYQTLSAGYADKAGNLESWESRDESPVENESNARVRTTAGDESINGNAGATLLSFICRGADYTPTKIISSGVNLLRLQSNNGLAVAIGVGWYFPVPKLTATNDSIGTANENNGVLFVGSDGNNLTPTVRFKAIADGVPTSVNDGVVATYLDKNGRRHYTTSGEGYLIVSGITYASTCARIAWSTDYDKFVSPTSDIDAGTIVSTSGIGTLRSVGSDGIPIFDRADRISDTQMRKTVNVGTSTNLTWTNVQKVDSEGTPTGNYKHTATITGMLLNGIADIKLSGASEFFALTVDGTSVSFVDTNATVASGYTVKYQLEVPVISNVNVNSTFANISDWGIEYLEASGEGLILWQYAQGIPDSLYGLIAKREVDNEVIAQTFAYLKSEIDSLNARLKNYGETIKAGVIDASEYMTDGKPMFLECSTAGAPNASRIPDNWDEKKYGKWTGIPLAPHSFYYDKASGKVYFAPILGINTGMWKLLN